MSVVRLPDWQVVAGVDLGRFRPAAAV